MQDMVSLVQGISDEVVQELSAGADPCHDPESHQYGASLGASGELPESIIDPNTQLPRVARGHWQVEVRRDGFVRATARNNPSFWFECSISDEAKIAMVALSSSSDYLQPDGRESWPCSHPNGRLPTHRTLPAAGWTVKIDAEDRSVRVDCASNPEFWLEFFIPEEALSAWNDLGRMAVDSP